MIIAGGTCGTMTVIIPVAFAGSLVGLLVMLGIMLLCTAVALFASSRAWYKITLQNNTLTLESPSAMQKYFYLDALKACDFIFTQGESQEIKNRGNIRVKGLNFVIQDVENFSEVKKYVEENF